LAEKLWVGNYLFHTLMKCLIHGQRQFYEIADNIFQSFNNLSKIIHQPNTNMKTEQKLFIQIQLQSVWTKNGDTVPQKSSKGKKTRKLILKNSTHKKAAITSRLIFRNEFC